MHRQPVFPHDFRHIHSNFSLRKSRSSDDFFTMALEQAWAAVAKQCVDSAVYKEGAWSTQFVELVGRKSEKFLRGIGTDEVNVRMNVQAYQDGAAEGKVVSGFARNVQMEVSRDLVERGLCPSLSISDRIQWLEAFAAEIEEWIKSRPTSLGGWFSLWKCKSCGEYSERPSS